MGPLALAKLRRDAQILQRKSAAGKRIKPDEPVLAIAPLFSGCRRNRRFVFLGVGPLPGPAGIRNRYVDEINSRTFLERNITDAVTAVNFDYRGFDTVGEEFILFVSVLGSLVLLHMEDEKNEKLLPDASEPWRDVRASEATRLWIYAMIAPKAAFGIYVITHGQLTPGGGFQGGVVLASVARFFTLERASLFSAMFFPAPSSKSSKRRERGRFC